MGSTAVRVLSAGADSAYRSKACEEKLAEDRSEATPIAWTRDYSTTSCDARIAAVISPATGSLWPTSLEHVFGAQAAMGGHIVRTIGLTRAQVKIGMMNLVYNMKRLGQLLERDAEALVRALDSDDRRGASTMA